MSAPFPAAIGRYAILVEHVECDCGAPGLLALGYASGVVAWRPLTRHGEPFRHEVVCARCGGCGGTLGGLTQKDEPLCRACAEALDLARHGEPR